MMCTLTATMSPRTSRKPIDTAVVGTPRAAAETGSSESNRSGRHMSTSAMSAMALIAMRRPS